ncbi:MAG: saccharopine dehydrogenase family protein [Candidatus Baldrarchaeia archaeon]
MTKINVIGAGLMGRGIIIDLLKSPEISQITVSDFKVEKAKEIVNKLQNEKLSAEYIDVRDEEPTAAKIKDFDVVVYAGWYKFNMNITRAAIKAGVNYLDLGGLYRITLEQLKLNKEAKDAGITVLLGMGASPGTTNVLAKYCSDKMDSVEEIHIRAGIKNLEESNFYLPYSAMTIFDEFTLNPVIFRNGEYIKVDALSGDEIVSFPEPVGNVKTIYTLHSEIATLPKFINKGIKAVDFKLGLDPIVENSFKTLIELGFTETEPIIFRDVEIVPREFTAMYLSATSSKAKVNIQGCIRVKVSGKLGEKNVTRQMDVPMPSELYPGLTEVSASIGCQMLARGEIRIKGALPPEACIDPEGYIQELTKRGYKIKETIISTQTLNNFPLQ